MNLKLLQELPPWEWPSDAGDKLRKLFRDKAATVAVRETAATLAGETVVTSDELVNDLLAVLEDATEPESLRAIAASALGPALEAADTVRAGLGEWSELSISRETFLGVKAALRKIVAGVENPKLVRRRALETAVRASEEWHREAIRQAYAEGDPEWRLTAVFCMYYVRGFSEQILESLDSDDEEIFFEAVRAAGGSEVKEAWPRIAQILEAVRNDKTLLFAAIEAAPNVNPADAETQLMDLMESEDPEIAEAAAESLSMARAVAGMSDFDYGDDDDDDEIEQFFSAGGQRM